MIPNIIHFLFDSREFIDEDIALNWYNSLPVNSPLITAKLKELIEWIKRDDTDSDDE